jgi:hypothetical protein
MGETQRKSVDLTQSEGDAAQPAPFYVLVPSNILNGDPVELEGEPNVAQLPGFYRDPTDRIKVPDEDEILVRVKGLGLKAIGHSVSVVSTFAGVAAVSEYVLHLGTMDSAVVGLVAAVGGKVTLAVTRKKNK